MAHQRQRFLLSQLIKASKQSPCISLLGMRQIGKTTLLKTLVKNYLTLDHEPTIAKFRNGDYGVLDQFPKSESIGIDECQKHGPLFDAVKLRIDHSKTMGRFWLTGSVRFLSKKNIKESLTGRTLIFELLPMTLAETHEKPHQNFLKNLLKINSTEELTTLSKKNQWVKNKDLYSYWENGGMPGICFKRNIQLRADYFESHIETLISRDLPMLYNSRISVLKIKELIKFIAMNEGEPISEKFLTKKIGVSPPTIKVLLEALQSLYLLRQYEKNIYFIEDMGIAHHLDSKAARSQKQIMTSFFHKELQALLHYSYHRSIQAKSFITRGGSYVPFVISLPQEKTQLGFCLDPEEYASEKSVKSLGVWEKSQKIPVKKIALHMGTNAYEATNGTWCLPLSHLF